MKNKLKNKIIDYVLKNMESFHEILPDSFDFLGGHTGIGDPDKIVQISLFIDEDGTITISVYDENSGTDIDIRSGQDGHFKLFGKIADRISELREKMDIDKKEFEESLEDIF